MKQETSKKSKKWIWLVAGAVLLLAIVGVVLAMVLGGGGEDATGGRADLYWNVDRLSYLEGGVGLSTREPGEDGLYHVKFAYNGEHVEYTISDKKLINFVDSQEVMGLKFDDNGMVIDAVAVTDVATEVGHPLYVQGVEGNVIKANTSPSMNALTMDLTVTENTQIYDVSSTAEMVGGICDISAIAAMDRLYVYANDLEEITHIYIVKHAVKSPVYWRVQQFYTSSKKETTREPDENGVYSIDFFCDGELVTLKCKKKEVVNAIDSRSIYSAHMGLEFDAEGYIINTVGAAEGIGGLLLCDRYWITSFNGNTYTAEKPGTSDPVHNFAIPSTAKIYDVGKAAMVEGRQGKQVDYVNEGDRVCVWTDTNGVVVLVYVSNSIVDVPVFFNPDRQYDSKTLGTAREPDSQGYYCFELYEDGATGLKTYKTKDKAVADYLDSISSRIVGLVIKDGNIIERAYDPESVFGNTHYTYGRYVNDITGPIISCILVGQPLNASTAVLSTSCEVYNVSGYGEYGLTTLQVGDCVYAMRDPSGEVVRIYILRRYMGEEYLYFMLDSQYDAETKSTKREPDEDGWYRILFAHNGKQVTLRTRSKAMVEKVESIDSVGAAALIVSGDVIIDAHPPQNATGGSKVSSGYRVKSFNDDGTITTYYKTREATFRMADDCVIYNVSNHTKSYKGETIYSLQYGDMLTVFTNWRGEAKVVYVRNRVADNLGWKTEQKYDGTNKVTTREPDADGWYYVDIAVNGEVKTFKTKNKELMSNIDSYGAAFGFSANGNVLTGFAATNWTRGVGGNGVTNYDVVAINGNKVTVKYNVDGKGTTKTIYLSSNAKIYDVSPTAEKFGGKVKLQVGDRIRTYVGSDNKESHVYAYVLYHDTRVKGQEAYCEHCDQVVYWNPWAGEAIAKVGRHYYLNADVEAQKQLSVGLDSTKEDYEVVIDLNGKSVNYTRISSALVRYGETLSIMDSVGGGRMTSTGVEGGLTGMFMVSSGGIFNLYGGTIARSDNEARVSHGGLFRLSGSTLNIYGGEITNGNVEPKDEKGAAYGGNIYAMRESVINLYGGKVSAGRADSLEYTVLDEETGEEVQKRIDGVGGNIYMTSKSVLNVYGGELVGGNAVHGGNVYVAGGTANFYGGVVADGVATNGGNIYVGGGAKAIVQGEALITRGNSTRGVSRNNGGGNVFTQKNADFIMLGGSVTDGTAVSYGGNIACRAGRFTIEGGVVSGGKSETGRGNNVFINGFTGSGTKPESDAMMVAKGGKIVDGDVYIYEPDSEPELRLGLSGNPAIEHLRMDAGALAELYELKKGADINVEASGVFTKPYAKAESYVKAGYIKVHESAEGVIKVQDNALSLVYEKYCAHCDQNVVWTKWKHQNGGSATAIKEDGHYYLAEDVLKITAQMRVGVGAVADDPKTPDVDETAEAIVANAILDLNGHSMQSEKRVFAIYPGSTLSVIDSVGGGEIRGAMIDKSQNGGVIRVDAGSTLNLYSGTITDIAAEAHLGYGGALSTEGGTINILGGTVNGGTTKYGGTIYVAKSSKAAGNLPGNLNISGGVINGGVATHEVDIPYGGAIFVSNGNFTMTGGKVTGGQVKSDAKTPVAGNIYLSGNDTYKFEITGGIIENGIAHNGNGGNIYINAGTLTIGGEAVITGGVADRASARTNGGGNIYAQLSTTLNINGGEIKDGTAVNSYGGNLLVRGNATMTGGVISGGTATNGGNVFVNGYTAERVFTMTGGEIKDGTATTGQIDRVNMVKDAYDGDNIYVNSAIIDISGGTITDNDGGNAILAYTAKTDFPAIVKLTLADNEKLAANLDSLIYLIKGTKIYADKGGTKTDADGDKVWMLEGYDNAVNTQPTTAPTEPSEPTAPTEPPVADLTGNCPHCGEKIADLNWIEWTVKSGGTVKESGHYYLTGDVKGITSQLRIGVADEATPDVVLDLRGYVMQSAKRVFAVYPGSSLSIMDTAGSGTIKGAQTDASQHGGVIRVDAGSTLNLYSGTITDVATKAHAGYGGALSTEGGTINIFGGTVNGGTARYGGTIYVSKAAAASGGAAGNLNISGGVINGGVATHETESTYGGAIFVSNGNFRMTGGLVTGGRTTSDAQTPAGGNIYLSGNNTYIFEITGGTIENGTAVNGNGGNIYLANGELTIAGDAKIVGGVAERGSSRNNGGGNIYGQVSVVLNINGGEITDGVATNSYGGNILMRGTLNMTDGVIAGGTATNGGNVFVNGYDRERVFTMSGGTIKDGTATTGQIDRVNMVKPAYDGDNIYVNSAILNISGGMITDNDGGNAILAYTSKQDYPATVNMTIAQNTELVDALEGKVYLVSGAVLTTDIGGTSVDSDDDEIWYKVPPVTEPTEPDTEPTTVPTEPTTPPVVEEGACPHCGVDMAEIEWTVWAGTGHLSESGHYYLESDIAPDGQRRVGYESEIDVVVDLRGHTYQPSAGKRTFTVYNDSTLTVLDTVGGAQVIGSYTADLGGTINITLGTVNLYGGTFSTTNTENANEGGVIAVGENSNLNVYEGATIIGGPATMGGAIYTSKGNINIYGGLIQGSAVTLEASNPVGGAIAVLDGGFFMSGGKVTGGSAVSEAKTPSGGNIYLRAGAGDTLTITGGVIENGAAVNGNGGNIYLQAGTLTIAGDAKIIGGIADRTLSRNNGGGNIYVQVDATLNINGGEIANGTAAESFGGNILCRGTLNMTDGVISGGTALNGGNVFMNGYSVVRAFTMTGGTIKDGTATTGKIDRTANGEGYDGDNIYVNSAIMNISGGMISDNDGGNAVLAYTPKTDYPATINLQLADKADLANALDGKVYLIGSATVVNADIGGTSDTADGDKIWNKVAPETEPTETTAPSVPEQTTAPSIPEETTAPSTPEETTAPSVPEQTTAPSVPEQTTAPSVPEETTAPTVPADVCPHCNEKIADLTWTEWTFQEGGEGNTIRENVHYYLTNDVLSITAQVRIGVDSETTADVVIDLRGHTMQSTKRVLAVYPGSSLSIMDTVGNGEIKGAQTAANQNGGVIRVDAGSTLNLYSGTITDVATTAHLANGGALSTEGGTINIFGGTVNGGTARYGGAIYVSKAAAASGGAAGNLNISGGVINGGVASHDTDAPMGGAIAVINGNFNMTGGKVTGGSVTTTSTSLTPVGGNIYLSGNNTYTFEITGGTIENGTAVNGNGGNIYLANGELTIAGNAKIVGGTATRTVARNNGGGNIYGQVSVVVNINGGEITNGNCENSYGGNVFMRGTLNMTDGVISGGTAINGGNVFVNGYSAERVFTMTGGTIKDGTATTGKIDRTANGEGFDGDNVYINSAIMSISGGMIADNDGGNAILAYTPQADYPATVNLQVAEKADLANALDGKVYLIGSATVVNADIGGTSDTADGDKIWNKVAPETEPTETTAPSVPEETTVPSVPEETTVPSVPEETTAPTVPEPTGYTAVCPCHGLTVAEIDAITTADPTDAKAWVTFDGTALADNTHYRLDSNLSINTVGSATCGVEMTAGTKAMLYLNNSNIDMPMANDRFVRLLEGAQLTICGSGTITGQGNGGGVVYLKPGALFNLYDVTLTNTRVNGTSTGGVVYLEKGAEGNVGVFNMYSGTLNAGAHSAHGGAIVVSGYTRFNMYGGIINGSTNELNKKGGAIYGNASTAEVYIYGGTINSGNFTDLGNAISLSGSKNLAISGGTINGEVYTSSTEAGAVTLSGAPVIEKLNLSAGCTIAFAEGGVTGGSIGVTGNAGPISEVSADAASSVQYFSSVDGMQISESEGQIHLAAALRSVRSLVKAVIAGGLKGTLLTR